MAQAPRAEVEVPLGPMRWDPVAIPDRGLSLIEGVSTVTTAGDASPRPAWPPTCICDPVHGERVLLQRRRRNAVRPGTGGLRFWTEFGIIDVEPGEIVVIPRGVKMRVELLDGPARGYICENYGGTFTLPERGPIGANCLANPRDFLTPVAAYEEVDAPSKMYVKWGGTMWVTDLEHSPLDVVAWHGNYAPYKYDLRRFSRSGRCCSTTPTRRFHRAHRAVGDPGHRERRLRRVPDRWMVAEDTFRPPWYHMNIMSEFMGLIYGVYDASRRASSRAGSACTT